MKRIYYMIEDRFWYQDHKYFSGSQLYDSNNPATFGFGGLMGNEGILYSSIMTYQDCRLMVVI